MTNKYFSNILFARKYLQAATALLLLLLFAGILTGCGRDTSNGTQLEQQPITTSTEAPPEEATSLESSTQETHPVPAPEVINEVDYSAYFNERKGCAVFYTPSTNQYDIYNTKLADLQRSPCSTFKIISSLIGLESGVIDPQNSVRPWSGESFWMPEWNQDLDFLSAFQTSCVWYFRQVIDEIGKQDMQTKLAELTYGNQDISDWKGKQNTNNNNRALTGFWIESSLKISPKQQTEVMAQIFEPATSYSATTIDQLKEAMHVAQTESTHEIYGKTGAGKDNNVWVDAWFVGMIEREDGNVYFAIYMGESGSYEISSKLAKEIAIEIARDYYSN